MKTLNSIIATITIITVIIMAMLTSFTASANVYEDRLNEAFNEIISAVSVNDLSQSHTLYSDPETGTMEGKLDVYKFALDRNRGLGLVNAAKDVYDQISDDLDKDLVSKSELYTLWWTDHDNSFSGYRLYYSPENAVIVGLACDYCYTVGFLPPGDTKHRKTYTIEWDEGSGNDSILGRIVTTYAPVIPQTTTAGARLNQFLDNDEYDKYMEQFQAGMEKYQEGMEKYKAAMDKAQGALSGLSDGQSQSFSFSTSRKNDSNSWMKKLLFYVEKVQQSGGRYIYLSNLYNLCKDTDGLDQTDLKIAKRQLASVYQQLKAKNKLKESELVFLESMVDLLESKIQK